MNQEPAGRRGTAGGLAWASILVPLTLGFVLSLLLAHQALDANNRHRVAARSMARDQAQFAAYLLAATVDRHMQQALLFAFYPVDLALGRTDGPLPEPGVLNAPPESARCEPEASGDARHYFRYIPASGDIAVAGPYEAEWRNWLGEAGPGLDQEGEVVRHARAEVGSGQALVVYKAFLDGTVIYGFETCWRASGGNVFEVAGAETQAFSPAAVGDTPNDSLFSMAVRYPDGTLAHGDAWTRPGNGLYAGGDFYGTVPLTPSASYAGAELRVTLRPRVAERLVEGGVPPSRLPLAVGLLVVNGLLMWIAFKQLRRGHELVRLRESFIRNVSHELRTPLQQILLFTELLRSGHTRGPDEERRALGLVHSEVLRLIELVKNLLVFSRSAPPPLRTERVALEPLVVDVVDTFRPLAEAGGAALEIRPNGKAAVVADVDALRRVLVNLLDNAVKYGPIGQTVVVESGSREAWGWVAVSDEGPGVPEGETDRIWESFHRLERDQTGPTAGSGIGLSIVRRLVREMHGQVKVERAAGGGARFEVLLPAAEAP